MKWYKKDNLDLSKKDTFKDKIPSLSPIQMSKKVEIY